MTIHSAKGLEFPYVFLIGMEEGVFPSEMSKYSEADLEEERRLAYVGITRAKKELYISNSVSRMLYGRTQRNEPSRFLREIEPEYIEETRSPALERRSSMGWGSSYSDTVPGGASGYSGASGWGRNSSSFGAAPAAATSTGNTMPLSAAASAPVMQAVAAVLPGLAAEAAPRARPAPPVWCGLWPPRGPQGSVQTRELSGEPGSFPPGIHRPKALRGGRHCGAQGLWPGQGAGGQGRCRRPDRGDQL